MLRKFLLTSVIASAIVSSAYAADLPSRRPPPAAYAPPIPIFTWTGFFIGVNAGGALRAGNNSGYYNAAFFGGAAPVAGFNNNNSGRFIGGGQVGMNWQINQFVLGTEVDGQALVGGNNNFPGAPSANNTGFLGTVRGRAGVAFDRFLVYGTGGLAFGSAGWPNTVVATVGGIPGFFSSSGGDTSRIGYAAGAGVEYAFTNNWSVKAEYLFTDLGRNNRTFFLAGTPAGFTFNNREQNHIVRAGLNYRFGWGYGGAPVLARY
jgi:outer membrane immunogenic protein